MHRLRSTLAVVVVTAIILAAAAFAGVAPLMSP
jgi:hypothetical protein